jgi:hypothetical protein
MNHEAIEFKFLRLLHLCPLAILFYPRLSTKLLTPFTHLTLMMPLNSRPPVIQIDLASLNNLAIRLHARFEQQGVPSGAIELYRWNSIPQATLVDPHLCLLARLEQRGIMSDRDATIELHWAALLLCSFGRSG